MVAHEAQICVLLSTYDGARFLRPCLDSLLAQTQPGCVLDVRDDGSSDATADVLAQYAAEHRTMRVARGENLGVAASFFALLEAARPARYYAFADQDDVWMPEKLARAVAQLERLGTRPPALYCASVLLADAELNVLGRSPPVHQPSFANALAQNVAQGCTIVIDQAARALLLATRPTLAHIAMFDWWAYLLIAGAGTVIFDDHPLLYYRQHGANVIGTSASPALRGARTLAALLFSDAIAVMETQARELDRCARDHLTEANQRELARFLASRASLAGRVHYAVRGRARRNTRLGTAAYRLASIVR